MLQILVPGVEMYDENENRFIQTSAKELWLEHSLVSISKWESKWKKPFLGKGDKTRAETIDYIRCMTITQNVDPTVYQRLTNENIRDVNRYIDDSMTATTFRNVGGGRKVNNGVITSEIIYYWMFSFEIPKDCEKWHLNRLLTLIRVFDEKNKPGKKMSAREEALQRHSLNQARRMRSGSRG